MQIKILSSCGNTLLFGQTATLTVQLYDDNDNIIMILLLIIMYGKNIMKVERLNGTHLDKQ